MPARLCVLYLPPVRPHTSTLTLYAVLRIPPVSTGLRAFCGQPGTWSSPPSKSAVWGARVQRQTHAQPCTVLVPTSALTPLQRGSGVPPPLCSREEGPPVGLRRHRAPAHSRPHTWGKAGPVIPPADAGAGGACSGALCRGRSVCRRGALGGGEADGHRLPGRDLVSCPSSFPSPTVGETMSRGHGHRGSGGRCRELAPPSARLGLRLTGRGLAGCFWMGTAPCR